MYKKIISFLLSVVLSVGIIGVAPVFANEENKFVFSTYDEDESFSQESIFVVKTYDASETPKITVRMNGKIGQSKCRLTVFDSSGSPASSLSGIWDSYSRDIYPKYPINSGNDIFYDKGIFTKDIVTETTVEFPKPTINNGDDSFKYFVVVSPSNCDVSLCEVNNDSCTIDKPTGEDAELINYTIAPEYYDLIVVRPIYLYPEVVNDYLNEMEQGEGTPFLEYGSDLNRYIPKHWADVLNFVVFDSIGNITNYFWEALTYEVSNVGDTYDETAYLSERLTETYIDILQSILIIDDIDESYTYDSEYDMEKYYDLAEKASQLNSLEEFENSAELEKYAGLFKECDAVQKIGKGAKWWRLGGKFIAGMLFEYDRTNGIYIEAIDAIYSQYDIKPYDIEAHEIAIENVRNVYSDEFAKKFWAICEESGVLEEVIKFGVDYVINNNVKIDAMVLSKFDAVQIGIDMALEMSGIGAEINMQKKVMLSQNLFSDVNGAMMKIEDGYDPNAVNVQDLENYACLHDIAKAIRVYQYQAVKDGDKTLEDMRKIDRIIREIKNINIDGNNLEIVDPTPPTDDPTSPTNDPNPPTPPVAFEKIGNGNVANGGFAATDGEYVYYSADHNLYKQNLNGGDREVLVSDTTCGAINIYDGYVYYQTYSGVISRVKIDGGEEEFVTYSDWNSCAQVVDGYLYYASDYEIKKLSIADIGSESLEKTVLGETNDVFVVDNGSIYFLNSDRDRGAIGLASMSTNGDDFRILVEGSCGSINVVDGYVYYIKNPYGNNGFNSIYRVGVNGGNEELLLEEEGVFNINVYNNNIYFDREDPEYELGSISVSGENKQFYEAEGLNEFCIINDIVYTRDPDGYENVDIFSLLTQ